MSTPDAMRHRNMAPPKTRQRRTVLLIFAFGLMLGGCFTSTAPKFPLSTAVRALGDGGHYVAYERRADGSFKRDEAFDIKPRQDGGYDFIDAKGKVTTLSMHRIGPDLYVAQASEPKRNHTDYAVFRGNRDEMLAYLPQCDKQNAATLKSFGVDVHKDECVIDHVADPTALFATLDLGESGSKIVRE